MDLTESEKRLLTLIGENPSHTRWELLQELNYKRPTTLSSKMSELKKAGYIRGPYYHINLNAVCETPVYSILAEIRFSPSHYDVVFKSILCIDCWEWIFPTIQGETLFAFFRSCDCSHLHRLLNVLRNEGVIEYRSYTSQNRWFVQNPDFSGSVFPQTSDLFRSVDIELCYPDKTHNTAWQFIDLKVMQYLQVRTTSIAEIQKLEKSLHGRFWRRHQIKHSIKKITEAGIAERKHYNISPFPRGEDYAFLLLIEGDSLDVLQFISSFGRGCRLYKAFTMSGGTGFLWCWCSPQVGPTLMKRLDNLRPRIEARCLPLKSRGHGDTLKKSFNEEYFDLEKQKWTFHFKKCKEEIEKVMERKNE
ncbi:MAG: hypothetical protein HXS41_11130 [Theionarchaea archaeon]|nr:hypothetical protein [Theionarchaea archaeon]MBU7000556.1 hypothetical protein [Theionarchaea archaeon]MBU7021599.1 hypothetical protein [Theionarchaea archaeon]MBU7035708.1 hypothetical protein [Theionarchaea archaeon]MBU7041290.1 hypothetical protein [Theionarchaea archaeon]